ncbi:hypothetical protein DPEC_G00373610 [Dallia pectoralis]|nr:hypothetical protein DPEC_G00373610 [Dallia pectoralis]
MDLRRQIHADDELHCVFLGPWRISQRQVTSIWTRSFLHFKKYQILLSWYFEKWRVLNRIELNKKVVIGCASP